MRHISIKMPVTGNLSKETSAQAEYEEQNYSIDSVKISEVSPHAEAFDNSSVKVSSTTVDSDLVAETSIDATVCMGVPEPRQSVSSMSISHSQEGFKNQGTSFDEPASQPSSSTHASLSNLSGGFQDAFTPLASKSCGDPEEKDSHKDVSNDFVDSAAERETAADSGGASLVEDLVSSTVDPGQVNTSGKPCVRYDADAGNVQIVTTDTTDEETQHHITSSAEQDTYPQSLFGAEHSQVASLAPEPQAGESNQTEVAATVDSVYFIQTTDTSGQVVTSIIDPNDISSYADCMVYRQCMKPDGEIETTVVSSDSTAATQEHPPEQGVVNIEETDTQQGEQQIIYAHDLSGHLTPIDPIQSANDVAPPGKQFVYMQDSTGRIIRTIVDANQTMIPGQQVYYTQSEDGQIITSVMDSAGAGMSEESHQEQQSLQTGDQIYQQQIGEVDITQHQQEAITSVVDRNTGFNIDNSMSGLSMLAELSHLTAGQTPTASGLSTEQRATSSTDSSSSVDMEEFRPVSMVTSQLASEQGLESVSSDIAELKVGETDSDCVDQGSVLQRDGSGHELSLITKVVSQMKAEQSQHLYSVSRDNLFVQWQNLDAMCWMDVVLIMLVYSPTLRPLVGLDPSHELTSTLLVTLLKANRQAQIIIQNLLKKSNGAVISGLQTGASNSASVQDPKTSKLVCKENMDEIGKAINILYAMREKVWLALQPRLRCERGKHNSPVLVLPLLVREKPAIKHMFTMSYRYVFKCEKCSYTQDDSHTKILPSIPAVPHDFNMTAPCFVRNCFECQAPNQRMMMKFEKLQDFVQMHFVKGLPHSRFEELSFNFNDDHYEVTAVVHYKNNPDHFIAWVRNAPGPAWMECDDLKSVLTRYLHVTPNIPPSQVHMVMWERRLTPQHTLVMRDTEDTKLLASLLLTVQQPAAHQSTDQDARSTGLPGGTAASLTTTQTPFTNILSGLVTQTFTPYTNRGRSRGRGYSSRGRAAATATPIIRRITPAITQASSPCVISSPELQTSQIVRLPVSALTNSGLNLRGSTPSGTRYVLIGNSFQAGTATGIPLTRAGTPSKVVVVKSSGGSAQMSAEQLLQLLQQTGAIRQVGARITNTLTTCGVNTVAPSATSASHIIQQDNTIISSSPAKELPATSVCTEETPASASLLNSSTESLMETESSENDQNKLNSYEQRPSSFVPNQTISNVPFSETADTTSQQALNIDTPIQSSEPAAHKASVSQAENASATSVNEGVTVQQPGLSGQTVSISQGQQPRYIQVANPAGGGVMLCQLSMRDGKMVLLPVDRNAQTKVTGSSIVKLSSTPTQSPKITVQTPSTTPQGVSASSTGTFLSQVQKQLLQTQNSNSGASTGPRIITVPGMSGNTRIQLVTVPQRQADQSVSKTVILGTVHNQQTDANTAASSITQLITPGGTADADGHLNSQFCNIANPGIQRPEGDNLTTLSASLGTPDISLDGGAGHLVATSAVSLLRNVSARLATSSARTSLLTSSQQQQKPQESFRYILPGSNTTHILHTGTIGMQGGLGQAGRTFTTLSSSGTIIGGQLTPSPASSTIGTSPMDQDLTLDDMKDSVLTAKRRLSKELDTTQYIPLGRKNGRGRGRQRGGRGRGGRGRGRSQLWTPDAELIAPAPASCQKVSSLADLRQIGAHVIEAGSEAVDGVPVVSIPDFSTEASGQTEILSAAHSIIAGTHSEMSPEDVDQISLPVSDSSSAVQEQRVITQPIPSLKANHGFDILTQGILGSSNATRPLPSVKQARSLLTGKTTTVQSTSSHVASFSDTRDSSLALGASASHTIGQSEIDTLIQAAQAAAKPCKVGSQVPLMDVSLEDTFSSAHTTRRLENSGFGMGDTPTKNDNDDQEVHGADESSDINESMSTQLNSEQDGTFMSIDESQVSAAERYRMPTELFQPEEESPEKSVRLNDNINRTAVSQSPEMYQKSENSLLDDEISRIYPQQNRDGIQHQTVKKLLKKKTIVKSESSKNAEDSAEVIEPCSNKTLAVVHFPDSTNDEGAIKVIENKELIDESAADELQRVKDNTAPDLNLTPKKVARSRGRPKGSTGKHVHRRVSGITGAPESMEAVSGSVSYIEAVSGSSPERKFTQMSVCHSSSTDPAKHLKLESASSGDLVKDSFLDFDNLVADKPDETLIGEDRTDITQDSHQDEAEHECLIPQMVGRSRGRPRGNVKKHGRKGKSGTTIVPERMEIMSTSPSAATSLIDTGAVDTSGSLSEGEFNNMSGTAKESLQQSKSINIGGFITNSLIESDKMAVVKPKEELTGEDHFGIIQHGHQDKTTPDRSLTSKKIDRPKGGPKGGTGKRGGRRISDSTSMSKSVDAIGPPSLLNATSDVKPAAVFTSGSSPEGKFTQISCSEIKSLLHSCDTSPTKHSKSESASDLLIDSGSVVVGNPKEEFKCEDSVDVVKDRNLVEPVYETLSEKVGRSRGRPRGRKSKHGIRGKFDYTIAPEPMITASAETKCMSDATSLIDMVAVTASGSLPGGDFIPISRGDFSPEKEPLQHSKSESVSTEGFITNSLRNHDNVVSDKPNEEVMVGDSVDIVLGSHQDEAGPDRSLIPEKVDRPKGRPRGSTGKRGGKRKSDSSIESEPVEIISMSTSDAALGVTTSGTILPEGELTQHSSSNNPARQSIVQEHYQKAAVPFNGRKQNMNTDKIEQTVVRKHDTHPAVVHYRKKKSNWDIDSCSENLTHPSSPFRYKVLTGKHVIPRTRHPSLGPVQESFILPPASLPSSHKPRKSHSLGISVSAVVMRRRPKPQQKSEIDPSKKVTVMPLAMKNDNDPACTGGSFINDPDGGKMFTGVIVRHKPEKADWSCSINEQAVVQEHLAGQELKKAQRIYCTQLLTALYMNAGDFSATVDDSSDDNQLQESMKAQEGIRQEGLTDSMDDKIVESNKAVSDAEVLTIDEASVSTDCVQPSKVVNDADSLTGGDADACSDSGQSNKAVSGVAVRTVDDASLSTDSVQSNKADPHSSKGKKKKHKRLSMGSFDSSHPAKRAKSSQGEGSSLFQSPFHSVNSDSSPVAAPSYINDLDTVTSTMNLSQSASDSEFVQTDTQREVKTSSSLFSYPSPTRRSGRTPIPSKKILDALDHKQFHSSLKVRRASSASSDEKQSGFSIGDLPQTPQNIKQATSLS